MRLTLVSWLDRELVRLYDEGTPGRSAADATRDLLGCFDAALQPYRLSLDDTVRTRLHYARKEFYARAAREPKLDGRRA